jgi:hypothetical protein
MPDTGATGDVGEAVARSTRKATRSAKDTTAKATRSAKDTTAKATRSAKDTTAKATRSAKDTAAEATETAKDAVTKAAGTARAVRAARGGRVQEAREVAADADVGEEGRAAAAIVEAEEMHYRVEVNKRGFSAPRLTKTLNDMWDNGWRLAHVLEQRGNTVLVFEKRS